MKKKKKIDVESFCKGVAQEREKQGKRKERKRREEEIRSFLYEPHS